MESFLKLLIFSPLIVATCGRYVSHERNFSSISEETDCNCDWRYFKHYETKGCVVDQQNSCGCPKKFNCPSLNQTLQSSSKVCTYKNKEYKIGSKIITSDDCQVCRCRDGVPPFMSCVSKECPDVEYAPGSNCHLVYRENKCCPVAQECLENASEYVVASNNTCEYNGKLYPFGSKIYPAGDPCQICICNELWNGTDNSSCYQHDCVIERSRSKLDIGCVPVYHENRCCPIEFYCPFSDDQSYSVLSSNETENNEIFLDGQCYFGGDSFQVGDELSMGNPCIKCNCTVPPDFTCVHQSCPPSPNDENCYAVYNPEMCCPNYECMVGDAEAVAVPDGCPTPLCADSSCHIEIPSGHDCPTCVCGERESESEHNSVQQVQQISQNIEPFQQFEGYGEIANDYSEDELQMMPITMQDSEGQFSVMEKIILPQSEDLELDPEEDFIEMEDSSRENNSSTEIDNTEFKKDSKIEKMLNGSIAESELDETATENISNQTEKVVQKRSDISDAANPDQAQVPVSFEQNKFTEQESNTTIEREGGITENNETKDFEDELESFKNKISDKNHTISNEILGTNGVEVPEGCPTPMCEGPWCKIGIPPGHKCPTCICKRHVGSEP